MDEQPTPHTPNIAMGYQFETEVYGANIKYGANKAEPLIGRLPTPVSSRI
jgi:hypothetical protein